jgi:hypothetical protein
VRERPTPAVSPTSGSGETGKRRQSGHFSLLHADPVVLYAWEIEIREPASGLWAILEALPVRASFLVVEASFTPNDPTYCAGLAAHIRDVSQRFDHLVVVVNCPTIGEVAALRRQGVPALHCSPSALVRDDFFKPSPGRQPKFDAIYDAKWADVKRHDLAGRVQSLALIAPPPWRPETGCTIDYFRRAHAAVRRATWISQPWGSTKRRWISHEQINAAYNQARVGLCLSRYEGAMLVGIQYLLAGLPVVTTRHIGGRDEFFDPSYVRWVEDDPDAVAGAVDELGSLNLDPQMIREATLAKVRQHRARFQAWTQRAILAEGGELGRWSGDWPEGLPNVLREPPAGTVDVLAEISQEPSLA